MKRTPTPKRGGWSGGTINEDRAPAVISLSIFLAVALIMGAFLLFLPV